MKSIEWMERAKKAGKIASDRQLAIALGITTATMSYHRSGRNKTLNEEHCVVIAELCGIDPAIVLADQQAERATSPAVRKVWERMGKLAAAGAAASFATICLANSLISFQIQEVSAGFVRQLCILC